MPIARRRPSPALLIALLALFVALTGTAAAAVLVSSPDQLADEVVTSPKIARNAVTNSRIGDNAINSRTLAPQSVRNTNLGNNAVDASKIAPDTVGNSELDVGAVANENMIHPVYSATVLANGTTTTSVGVTGAGKIGTGPMVAGLYNVTFEKDVSDCAFVAAAGVGGSNATAHVAQGSPKVVNVGVWRPKYSASIGDVFPWGEDGPFTIIAQC